MWWLLWSRVLTLSDKQSSWVTWFSMGNFQECMGVLNRQKRKSLSLSPLGFGISYLPSCDDFHISNIICIALEINFTYAFMQKLFTHIMSRLLCIITHRSLCIIYYAYVARHILFRTIIFSYTLCKKSILYCLSPVFLHATIHLGHCPLIGLEFAHFLFIMAKSSSVWGHGDLMNRRPPTNNAVVFISFPGVLEEPGKQAHAYCARYLAWYAWRMYSRRNIAEPKDTSILEISVDSSYLRSSHVLWVSVMTQSSSGPDNTEVNPT